MLQLSKLNLAFIIIIALLIGALGYNGITKISAHGGDTSLVHSCVKTSNGSLRIIGANDNCTSNETALDWTQTASSGGGNAFDGFPFMASYQFLGDFDYLFQGQDFTGALLTGISFRNNPDMHGVIFNDALIRGNELFGVNFSNASFIGATIQSSEFNGGDYTSANFTGASIIYSRFTDPVIMTNVNFTNANLEGTEGMEINIYTGVIWSNTICPDLTNSDSNGGTCEGHFIVE